MYQHPGRIMTHASVTLLLSLAAATVNGQTPQFRAFWADAWGPGFKSTSEIDNLVSRAVTGNYNAIIAEVMACQDNAGTGHGAYWNSSILPKALDILGAIDPLAYLCQQAHANGIEVHAWLVPFRVCTVLPPAGNATLSSHLEYFMTSRASIGTIAKIIDDYMLDPGSPDVQEYLVSIVRELVTDYPIDGVHWDYIRYTQTDAGYPSDNSYANSGLARFKRLTGYLGTPPVSGYAAWDDFRRREINELVRRVRAEVPAITGNPRQPLRYTAALICGGSTTDWTGASAYSLFQDWRFWLEAGWLDAGCPMNYEEDYLTDHAQTYRNWVDASIGWRYQRHMYCGQSPYKNTMAGSVTQMQYAYGKGANGTVNFSYRATADNNMDGQGETDWNWYPYVAANLFTSPAPLPTMPWRSLGTASEGTLFGRVTDAGTAQPIDDAVVQVGTLPVLRTDGNGYYTVTMIPAAGSGSFYTVTANKPGYTLLTHDGVQVVAGDVRRDDFAMSSSGQLPPTITQQPQTQVAPRGGTVLFTVTATCQDPIIYQWQKNDFDLIDGGHYSGATTASLTVSNVNDYDSASYRCAVTSGGGTTWSNIAVLTLENPGPDFIVESRVGGKNNYTNYSESGSLSK